MGPTEARDLIFASAGILWGTVTIFSGIKSWRKQAAYIPIPALIFGAILAFGCLSYFVMSLGGWAHAAETNSSQDLSAYLEKLQVKLEHTAQRANQPTSTGSNVAGLRGSKQEPISKQLYWKGKTGSTPVTIDEVKMFRTAVEQSKAGQNDQAATTLRAFLDKYPKSGLAPDATETLKVLNVSEPLPSEPPAPKS